jgi:pyrimidine-nucleoside phosphorylase
MHITEIIAKKRDKLPLSKEEIKFFVNEFVKGNIPDYQMSPLLMAIYLNGMNKEESFQLSLSMRDSGDIIDLHDIPGVKVDKHSTGGVGDKVSIVLGPLLAHLGVIFAKMSGRGLGHTGGTIDKLESIKGYKTSLTLEQFKRQVGTIGIALISQTGKIAPADKKLYALRDVTETISSIPLIASSIMSKKLASGADVICLDVKVGSGAFMKTKQEAIALSELMVEIGKSAGKKMTAVLTNMDEPLGNKIGNALEIYEAIETLKGHGPEDLVEVTCQIGSHLLVDAGIESDLRKAYKKLKDTLANGEALYKFKQLVKAQGGDASVCDHPEELFEDAEKYEIPSISTGYIEQINTLNFGIASRFIGAGREKMEDCILNDVGLDLHKKVGDYVKTGDILVTIYHHKKGLEDAIKLLGSSIKIGNKKKKTILIEKVIK